MFKVGNGLMPTQLGGFMVSSVSASTNVNQIHATDKVSQEQLSNPGLYSGPQIIVVDQPQRKRTTFLGFLTKLAFTAAVIGGVACLGKRKLSSLQEALANGKPEKGIGKKVKYYIAKLGDWVDEKIVKKSIAFFKGLSKKNEETAKTAGNSTESTDKKKQ